MIKEGDIVVCVKSHSMGLVVKGKEYQVIDVKCCRCGDVAYHVGISNPRTKVICSCRLSIKSSIAWMGHTLFRKRDEINASLESEIKECLIKELQEIWQK